MGTVAAWLAELAKVPTGLALAYVPGTGGVNARTREQLILAVTEVNGCRHSAWVHGSWLEFLGARDPEDELLPLFDYARACAEAGRPLDTTVLDAVYPAALVASVRATVARAEIGNIAGSAADGLLDTAARRRPLSWGAVAREALYVTAALPVTVPAVAAAGTMRLLDRLAPTLPDVRTPPPSAETNLVVDLLAQALPTYLGNTILRTGLVWAPLNVSIAFRMEGNAATLTVGRGVVSVDDGVSSDAIVVVDGGLDSLLRVVAGSLAGELTNPRSLRRP